MTQGREGQILERGRQGVGAVLEINGSTRAFDRFFAKLPASYGRAIDVTAAHVTLVEPAETAIDIFSERDLTALHNTARAYLDYLNSIVIKGMVLRPEPEKSRLEKFGRYLAIPIFADESLLQIRSSLAAITQSNLNTGLDKEYRSHLSVVRTGGGRKKTRDNEPPFPRQVHVNGFSVSAQFFQHDTGRLRSRQRYHNEKPQRRAH